MFISSITIRLLRWALLLLLTVWLPACLNGNLQWARSSDSTRNGATSDGGGDRVAAGGDTTEEQSETDVNGGAEEQVESFTPNPFVRLTTMTPSTASAQGGYPVVIEGMGFDPNAIVRIGTKRCPIVQFSGGTAISCEMPKLAPFQKYSVQIVNPDGTGVRREELFETKTFSYSSGQSSIQVADQTETEIRNPRGAYTFEPNLRATEMIPLPGTNWLVSLLENILSGTFAVRSLRVNPTTGILTPAMSAVAGTRATGLCAGPGLLHIVTQPNLTFGSLVTYRFDATGAFTDPSAINLGAGSSGCVVVSEKFVYVMNGQAQTISQFRYVSGNPEGIGATHEIPAHGSGPMAASPDGNFLVVATSQALVVFSINPVTGALTEVATPSFEEAHTFADIKFLPGTRTFYLADNNINPDSFKILTYSLDDDGQPRKMQDLNTSVPGLARLVVGPTNRSIFATYPQLKTVAGFSLIDGLVGDNLGNMFIGAESTALVIY